MRVLLAIVVAILLLPVSTANAHMLINDNKKTTGAILHIIPDDDPIAGEESMLYFDMQNRTPEIADTTVNVTIKTNDSAVTLPMKLDGTLATVDYTFPTQGVYELTFTVVANDDRTIFTQVQRVSRGVSGTVLSTSSHPWAEMVLVASCAGALVLAIVAFNRRRSIATYSTFKK